MKWYLQAFSNAFDFKGRAERPEFWYFFLFNLLIYIGFSFIFGLIIIGIPEHDINHYNIELVINIGQTLSKLYGLIIIIPSISVSIRRLHDIERSGFWLSIHLIPFVGTITLLILAAQASEPTNQNSQASEFDYILDHLIDETD